MIVLSMDLIVEIGNSHDGSLGIATSMVDMVESTGAKCVKFQLHLPEFESTPDEPFRAKFSVQDQSRFDYWKRVNFTEEEWKYLANYTRSKGLEFLCTPFSIEAAKFLFHNNLVERWKVSSGDCTNLPLIDYMTTTNLPMLISTGLASWEEILKVRDRLGSLNYLDKVTFLHCVSQYPTKIESAGLNIIDDLRKLSGKVGLSDHSGNWIVPLKAISLGIDTLEVHLTPNRYFFGPDVSSSLTTEEISKILEI
jgi:N-acetylneuraminate synthase